MTGDDQYGKESKWREGEDDLTKSPVKREAILHSPTFFHGLTQVAFPARVIGKGKVTNAELLRVHEGGQMEHRVPISELISVSIDSC
jgi:hypothetical protein